MLPKAAKPGSSSSSGSGSGSKPSPAATRSAAGKKTVAEPASPIKLPAATASADSIMDFIIKSTADGQRTLGSAKSVTAEMRNRTCDILRSIASAVELLRTKSDPDSTILDAGSNDVAASLRDIVREEMDALRQELVQRPPASTAASYAAAAAAGAGIGTQQRPKIKTPVSRPAIVLKPAADDIKSSKDVLNVWKKSVSFKDETFAPAKVQTVSNSGVRVEFDNVQQRDAAMRKLAAVSDITGEEAKRRRPLIILRGVSKDVAADDVVQLVRQQNPSVSIGDGDARKRFVRRNRKDELYNIVLEVAPPVRVQLLQLGRVNIDHQRVHCSDFSSLVQCFRCLGFGHTQSKCESEQHCSHCAASGHGFAACPDKKDASKSKCYTCSKSGRKDCCHSATSSKHCPAIQAMERKLASRTDFGC